MYSTAWREWKNISLALDNTGTAGIKSTEYEMPAGGLRNYYFPVSDE